jgi:type IV pilus assembly protein PilP
MKKLALSLALVTLLGGCIEGNEALRAEIEAIKQLPPPPLEPIPKLEPFDKKEYIAEGRRDPFADIFDLPPAESTDGPRPKTTPPEPLEAFPLDALKMVGTIGAGENLVGLVKDPDGTIHQVRSGNYMGQNFGRIVSIAEDSISLIELIQNGIGGYQEREAALAAEGVGG